MELKDRIARQKEPKKEPFDIDYFLTAPPSELLLLIACEAMNLSITISETYKGAMLNVARSCVESVAKYDYSFHDREDSDVEEPI